MNNNNPKDWTIYAYGSGWQAWNSKTVEGIVLTHHGTFGDAVQLFNEQIGDYYSSRPSNKHFTAVKHRKNPWDDLKVTKPGFRKGEFRVDGQLLMVEIINDWNESYHIRLGDKDNAILNVNKYRCEKLSEFFKELGESL